MNIKKIHDGKTARTKWTGLITLLVICAWLTPLAADDKTQAAIEAAESWLQLVDNGRYTQSWNKAADYFQEAVGKSQWHNALSAARKPLGKVISRQLTSTQHLQSAPGAPDGDYVVIQYTSRFSNKESAVETITPMKEKDGQWRVSGYYIR